MKTYHLVSSGHSEAEDFYWMLEKDDQWYNVLTNIWKPKHNNDVVKERVEVHNEAHLDWTETPLCDPDATSGWLCRDGRFYGCPINFHDKLAHYMLGMKVSVLEKIGWVRVNNSKQYSCEQRLSAEQRNWLSENGHKIYD